MQRAYLASLKEFCHLLLWMVIATNVNLLLDWGQMESSVLLAFSLVHSGQLWLNQFIRIVDFDYLITEVSFASFLKTHGLRI